MRHEALQPFSRDHHHVLLLCWKIREGLKNKVDILRIKQYADWFWENHLKLHFEEEEKYIFPILPHTNELILQAIEEHIIIKKLFEQTDDPLSAVIHIENKMIDHVRFEERILFNKIQEVASKEQLSKITELHKDNFYDSWEDDFWNR